MYSVSNEKLFYVFQNQQKTIIFLKKIREDFLVNLLLRGFQYKK